MRDAAGDVPLNNMALTVFAFQMRQQHSLDYWRAVK